MPSWSLQKSRKTPHSSTSGARIAKGSRSGTDDKGLFFSCQTVLQDSPDVTLDISGNSKES